MIRRTARLILGDPSAVGEARRTASALAAGLGFDEEERGEVALVVTELATNVVRHGGGGELLLQEISRRGVDGVEVIAIDRGPGMDREKSARDGFSTGGTSGFGLGAIRRMSARSDLHSDSAGTVFAVELFPEREAAGEWALDCGGLSVPHPHEQVCGDAWAQQSLPGRELLLVVDGLGHGGAAAAAATEAVNTFRANPAGPPCELMQRLNEALRPTRGAAAAVAELRFDERVVRFCGVGNISATVLGASQRTAMVSMNGTLGHGVRKFQEFQYPWSPGSAVILCSDGLSTHWSLERYAGGLRRNPAVIAGLLYRDFTRGRDDVTVVVAREPT